MAQPHSGDLQVATSGRLKPAAMSVIVQRFKNKHLRIWNLMLEILNLFVIFP